MAREKLSSHFQEVIETVEALPLDEQVMLIEIIHQRTIQRRRAELVREVAEARQAYRTGKMRHGTVTELMQELDVEVDRLRSKIY